MKITITFADTDKPDEVADYVRLVADLIEDDYTSGHTDSETYWDSEGLGT